MLDLTSYFCSPQPLVSYHYHGRLGTCCHSLLISVAARFCLSLLAATNIMLPDTTCLFLSVTPLVAAFHLLLLVTAAACRCSMSPLLPAHLNRFLRFAASIVFVLAVTVVFVLAATA